VAPQPGASRWHPDPEAAVRRVLYVNTTGETKDVTIDGTKSGVLSGKRWTGTLRLEPLGADLPEK
jgi:beta-galactosidase